MNKKEVIDFIKSLEQGNIVPADAHKNEKVVESIGGVISMSEEEHNEFQNKKPSKSVLVIFTEYQDWKETYKCV
jgi:hypothetical protein